MNRFRALLGTRAWRPTRIAALVAVLALAAASNAMAAPLYIELFCSDAAGPGQPIPFHGRVWNPGPSWFTWASITVWSDQTNSFLVGPVPLASGQVIEFSGSYYPTQTPSTHTVTAKGYDELGTLITTSTAEATCTAPPAEEICRTPGFWGTHAGVEKAGSQNITQAVIDAAGGSLLVCGQRIDNTNLNVLRSALEATCVSVKGEQRLQLARHLTAAALNCVVSGLGDDCAGSSIASLFSHCNDVCTGAASSVDSGFCSSAIDCFNNGGVLLDDGTCKLGTCGGDPSKPCEKDGDCGLDLLGGSVSCVPTPDNCHDRLLVNEALGIDFPDPGPAGSSNACNSATKNRCSFFSCN